MGATMLDYSLWVFDIGESIFYRPLALLVLFIAKIIKRKANKYIRQNRSSKFIKIGMVIIW